MSEKGKSSHYGASLFIFKISALRQPQTQALESSIPEASGRILTLEICRRRSHVLKRPKCLENQMEKEVENWAGGLIGIM